MLTPGAILAVLKRFRSISFSQYGEDVLLHAFRPRPNGFYVDVGAYHPSEGSNTYKLYLRGWRGITVEPNPDAAAAFLSARPRDTHLTIGVAPEPGALTYHRFADAKFNTFEMDEYREKLERAGPPLTVPCRPLSQALAAHAPGQAVDLLSVDCEGLDLQVLQSLDWTKTRPTVVIVEDVDGYRARRDGGVAGPIADYMATQNYAAAGQALFSFFYLDRDALADPSRAAGFDLAASQLGA